MVPLRAMLLMLNAVVCELESVKVWAALVVPWFWLLKVSEVGVRITLGGAPVPVKFAVCGLFVALSVTVNVALSVPTIVGANATSIEQLAPAASVEPQLFVCVKSPLLVPVIATLVSVIDELVVFCNATT